MRRRALLLLLGALVGSAAAREPSAGEPVLPSAPAAVDTGPDRSAPPAVRPPEPIPLPEPEVWELRPGVRVHHVRVPGLRKLRVDVFFRRGSSQIDGRPSAAFTAMTWLQDQRTRRFGEDEIARLEAISEIDVWTDGGPHRASARLEVPIDAFDEGLALLRDVIVAPRFSRSDLRLLRKNFLRMLLTDGPTRAGVLIDAALANIWYPREHPLGARPDVSGWYRVTRRQLRVRHRALLASAPVDVLVVADLDRDEIEPRLVELLEGVGVPGEIPPPLSHPPLAEPRVIGIDLANTSQVAIAVRTAAPGFDDPDARSFGLIDRAVGGAFLSRLNRELREERGLTYGIGSDLTTGRDGGHWTVTTELRVDRFGEALAAILRILDEVSDEGLEQAEVDEAVIHAVAAWNRSLATQRSAARVFGTRLLDDRAGAELWERLAAIRATTPEDTRAVAGRWLSPDRPRSIVVVGNRQRLEPELESLGLESSWIPPELVMLGGL